MKILITSIFLILFFQIFSSCTEASDSTEIIYAGTFDGRNSEGLYVFGFDRNTGELTHIQTVSDRKGPNFQALHPDGNILYSISGQAFTDNSPFGAVSAYSIDSESGMLTLINEQSVEGRGTAHISTDPLGGYVYVSNYSEGNLSMFRINEDGSLTEALDIVFHEGSSINEQRQTRPHVHSIIPSADGRYIYVSDLGTDKIMIYKVNRDTDKLEPAETPFFDNEPGSGPRHFTFHPGGRFAYSAEELSSTVAVLEVNQTNGALTQVQRISMLPGDFEGQNSAADIHVSPDGSFLYVSNRGHDSLVIYEIDQSTGELSLVGHESTRGGHPRNFLMDQKGEFVMVANRDDDNIAVFRRDKTTGLLTFIGEETGIPMVVCLTQLTL